MAASKKLRLPKKLVIDRSKWGRGHSGGYLLSDEGMMCCLGFACRAMGATDRKMSMKRMPIEAMPGGLPTWLQGTGECSIVNKAAQTDSDRLALINDSTKTTDAQKERAIKRIFAKHGCRVTFVNGADK